MNFKKEKTKASGLSLAMLLVLALLVIPSVSAFEFDNVKEYNPVTREVTIINAFGFGDDLAKLTLTSPLNKKVAPGVDRLVGEFTFRSEENVIEAFGDLYLTDLKNGRSISRGQQYKYRKYKEIEVDDYKVVCEDQLLGNGTIKEECTREEIGSHLETVFDWIPINNPNNEFLSGVTYEIGIFVDVEVGDYGDWIPQVYGIEIEEWATWTADLSVDLFAGYKLNEGITGTGTIIDVLGTNNGTSTGVTNTTGIIGSAYDWGNDQSDVITLTTMSGLGGTIQDGIAISFWTQTTSTKASSDWMTPFAVLGGGDNNNFMMGRNSADDLHLYWDTASGGVLEGHHLSAGYNDGAWHHIVYVVNPSTNTILFYVDGTNKATTYDSQASPVSSEYSANALIGKDTATKDYYGILDEFYIWNRTISQAEVTQLYNAGAGITFTDQFGEDPVITLNSPSTSQFTTSPQNLEINFTASDDKNLTDVKLYVNTILNQTNATGINNSDYIFDLNLGDGIYNIYGQATDNESRTTNSNTITITIDSIKPTFEIYSPISTETTTTLPQNSTLNVTTTDANLNSCWYYTTDNSTNVTYTCNTTTEISFTSGGYKTIYIFANDTLGNKNNTETTYLINYLQISANYDASVIESESYSIDLNVTASEITSINGTLLYNGVEYIPNITTIGNTSILSTNLVAPGLEENIFYNFNWTYNLNGIDYNSSNYGHEILALTPLFFSESCDDKALRFDIQDETNGSAIYGDVEYNFKFGTVNATANTVYGSLTNVTTFYGCINATVSPNYTVGYGELQYRSSGYVDRRYYIFEGQVISNNTQANHTLRDLPSVDQTSFLLTMEDTSLNVYAEKYTALWRWYPDLDEYQIVEMGKTDDDGETVAHVETEDVDYRVGLYDTDGTLIKLDNPRRFVCTSAPCSLTIRVGAGDVDYSSVFDVQAEITYNQTTGIFLLIYNDPNQLTSEMRFLVTRETGTNILIICNDTSSGFSGAMSCNTSMYNGLKKAVAYRSASPELPIAQKVVSSINTTFNSGFGLFISVILWLAIVLSGFGNNPIWTIILSVVGLIPALIMGSINIAIFTAIAVLASIIIHFIKRAVAR